MTTIQKRTAAATAIVLAAAMTAAVLRFGMGESAAALRVVHRVEITLEPDAAAALRKHPRKYAQAAVRIDHGAANGVELHLKGSVGSFQPLDGRPGFTVKTSKASGELVQGFGDKLHLNNSVEDPSMLSEQLGAELFEAAGVPAPKVSHARVVLNGRDLGLYVMVEGAGAGFLRRAFDTDAGCVFDQDQGQDVEGKLKAHGPSSDMPGRAAMARIAVGASDPREAEVLETSLDLGRFMSFMAVEALSAHRDGYCVSRNNYLVAAQNPEGRITFIPHGMDQLFHIADWPWNPTVAGTAAKAALNTPGGPTRYERRVRELAQTVFNDQLPARVDVLASELSVGARKWERRSLASAAADFKRQVADRVTAVHKMLEAPPSAPAPQRGASAPLAGWAPTAGTEPGSDAGSDGRHTLHLVAGKPLPPAWRAKANLPPGNYRLEGLVRTRGVQPLPYGRHQGPALRIQGGEESSAPVPANSDWRPVTVEFKIQRPGEETTVMCELRAEAGEAWFDRDAFKLSRLE
jgi:spore coat protein H